ncbi:MULTISPECIES: hypothetical protein [unclassified Haladaptatus]|uniref:hypothetical protein n=1 Tax=unclassified Haladaptatus TaxID=2622732 RepID=UPI0023E8E46E|nr:MULTISPECIES: hypothetical protein [unclassified Haladaptatus]
MPQSGTNSRHNSGQQRSNQQSATQQGGTQQGAGQQGQQPAQTSQASWFANTAIRVGVVLIGFVLLLFALGQAVGANLLGMVAEALSSQTGQWLVVAFFALLLIGAAQRGVTASR